MKITKEEKKLLLGEMGSALVQQLCVSKGYRCWAPWDVFHRSCDLVIRGTPEKDLKAQIKCKVPWAKEESQSFTQDQWQFYQHVDLMFFICAPIVGQYEMMDRWAGNIYSGVPKKLQTKFMKTRRGREMTLVPLEQPGLFLEMKITDKNCLELMKELTTGGYED